LSAAVHEPSPPSAPADWPLPLPRRRVPLQRRLLQGALLLLIGLLAALPRLTEIDGPVTADEALWFSRTSGFARALLDWRWSDTYRTGHPGVTTMWLGTIGMGPSRAAEINGDDLSMLDDTKRGAFLGARRALAATDVVLLLVVVALATRLFGIASGGLSGVLLALDPWLVGHNRVLHLDGLLTLLLAIAALGWIIRREAGGRSWLVLLTGVAAGLAVLTKSSALVLMPAVLAAPTLASLLRERGAWRSLLDDVLTLAVTAGLTVFLLWPALWAQPVKTVSDLLRFGLRQGGEAHVLGNYFLGNEVDDPGPAFYPAVLAFRLSPVLVVIAVWSVIVLWRKPRLAQLVRPAGLLVMAGALAVLVMSAGAKKQDRYVLPAVPLLTIAVAARFPRALAATSSRAGLHALALTVAGAVQLALCAGERPYYLSFYSPVLGGPPIAERVVPVGWGEGLELVAAYLNAQQTDDRTVVAAPPSIRQAFQAQILGKAVETVSNKGVTHQVVYVNALQRNLTLRPDVAERLVLVRVNGVDYAALYAVR
jgi:hypothetical protein